MLEKQIEINTLTSTLFIIGFLIIFITTYDYTWNIDSILASMGELTNCLVIFRDVEDIRITFHYKLNYLNSTLQSQIVSKNDIYLQDMYDFNKTVNCWMDEVSGRVVVEKLVDYMNFYKVSFSIGISILLISISNVFMKRSLKF